MSARYTKQIITEVLCASLFVGTNVSAAVCTWTGSINELWKTEGNWSECVVPANGDKLIFPAKLESNAYLTRNDLSENIEIAGIDIYSSKYTFIGNQISIVNNQILLKDNNEDLQASLKFDLPLNGNGQYINFAVDNSDTTLLISNLISGNTGISKLGEGTLILGANNTYKGSTNIAKGNLLINGLQSTSAVNISSTGVLGGTGKVGIITVKENGTISPANKNAGFLNVNGNVTFESTTNLNLQINGTTLGTDYDQLNAIGSINLNNSILNITLGFTPLNKQSFVIVKSTGDLIGTFKDLPNNSTFSVNGNSLKILYGKDNVTLEVVQSADPVNQAGNKPSPILSQETISIGLVAMVFLIIVLTLVIFVNKRVQKRKRLNKRFR